MRDSSHGFALMTPRIVFATATRGELPASLASLNPRTRVPAAAIVLNSFIALALGLASDFGQLATFAAISRLGIYVVTCIALIVLRRSHGPSPAFRAPAGPALPCWELCSAAGCSRHGRWPRRRSFR